MVRSWVQLHTADDEQRNQHYESDLPVTDTVRSMSSAVLYRHTLPWSSSHPVADCGPPLFNTVTHSTRTCVTEL